MDLAATEARAAGVDYDAAHPTALFRDTTFDYGVLIPSRNTCQLLQANGIVALDETWWSAEPDSVAGYLLFGIPGELTQVHGTRVDIQPTMARLDRLDTRPEGFAETGAPMLYGPLRVNPLKSLRGFSGGPIFSFGSLNEHSGYWLVAMQVSQLRGGRDISGMLMPPLIQFIRDLPQAQDTGA